MVNNSFKRLELSKDDNGNVIYPQTWVESEQAPIRLTLKQKINALVNVLNGMEYNINKDSDQKLLDSIERIYNQTHTKDQNFVLIKDADLKRYIGLINNAQKDEYIFLNRTHFIPDASDSLNGYVSFVMQINNADVSDLNSFKRFLATLGSDAFLKIVANLSQNPQLQAAAENDFLLTSGFAKLKTIDARLVQALGSDWATLRQQ